MTDARSLLPNLERDTRSTLAAEGIYDHDPDDPGAETFRGISRRYHPEFPGWPEIDRVKASTPPGVPNIAAALRHHRELEGMALDFYRAQYWNPLRLNEVVDGRIAEELFDQAVNLGKERAGAHLQLCLNALNRNGELYPDLVADGNVGNLTIAALQKYFAGEQFYEKAVYLLRVQLNVCQGWYYFESMRKSPIKEKYARGWFERVNLTVARE